MFSAFDGEAIARAEAAMSAMSDQFGDWLLDELSRLEAANKVIYQSCAGQLEQDDFYRSAHDLKGLGTTYGYPIVSQFAGSLCKLLDDPQVKNHPADHIIDAHVAAIVATVKQKVTSSDHPVGKALLIELQGQVNKFAQAT